MRVAVVSRGYGGAVHRIPKLVDASQDSAEVVGDESLMLARGLGAPVVVCTDRQAAVAAVRDWQLADVVLADDGLQHYRMARVFEIAVLDGERGVGNGRLLPAGPLREPVSRLDSVDWRLERGSCRDSAFRYTVIGCIRCRRESVILRGARCLAQWSSGRSGGPARQFFSMLARRSAFQQRALADHAAICVLAAIDADIVLVTAKMP